MGGVLVEDLIDAVIDRADLTDMAVRHPRATIMGYLTVSLRAVRAELRRGGFEGFLDWSTPAALPTAPPVTGENHLEVDWPSTALSIHGVDVNRGTSGAGALWYPLDTMALVARRNYYAGESAPRAWLTRTLPREATAGAATLDAGKIQIYPASTLGLEYRVLYFPEMPALANEAHVVQGYDGDWIEWAIWNATIMALFKDDEMDPSQDAKATRERAIIGERMLVNINRIQRAAPIQPTRHGGIHFRRF